MLLLISNHEHKQRTDILIVHLSALATVSLTEVAQFPREKIVTDEEKSIGKPGLATVNRALSCSTAKFLDESTFWMLLSLHNLLIQN